MKLSFFIQPAFFDIANANLYVEINEQGLSYIILENEIFVALVVYQFESGSTDDASAAYIHQIIKEQPVLLEKFNAVHIIYSFTPSILVPQRFMKDLDHNAAIQLVYGDANERVIRTEFIYPHAIQNIYGIPTEVNKVLSRYFGFAGVNHIYTLLPNLVKDPGNHLYCIFSAGNLKIILMKEGKLQVMQTFQYKTPEDAAYYLLNLCKNFNTNEQEINVTLSGMIDANSALYAELHKYFLLLSFESLPVRYQYPEAIHEYPAHYFSHLFSIAACV